MGTTTRATVRRLPDGYHSDPTLPARLRNTTSAAAADAAVDLEQLRRDGFALRDALKAMLTVGNMSSHVARADLLRAMRAVEGWDARHG